MLLGHSHKFWDTFTRTHLAVTTNCRSKVLWLSGCSCPTTRRRAWLQKMTVQAPFPPLLKVFTRIPLMDSREFPPCYVSTLPPNCPLSSGCPSQDSLPPSAIPLPGSFLFPPPPAPIPPLESLLCILLSWIIAFRSEYAARCLFLPGSQQNGPWKPTWPFRPPCQSQYKCRCNREAGREVGSSIIMSMDGSSVSVCFEPEPSGDKGTLLPYRRSHQNRENTRGRSHHFVIVCHFKTF